MKSSVAMTEFVWAVDHILTWKDGSGGLDGAIATFGSLDTAKAWLEAEARRAESIGRTEVELHDNYLTYESGSALHAFHLIELPHYA